VQVYHWSICFAIATATNYYSYDIYLDLYLQIHANIVKHKMTAFLPLKKNHMSFELF